MRSSVRDDSPDRRVQRGGSRERAEADAVSRGPWPGWLPGRVHRLAVHGRKDWMPAIEGTLRGLFFLKDRSSSSFYGRSFCPAMNRWTSKPPLWSRCRDPLVDGNRMICPLEPPFFYSKREIKAIRSSHNAILPPPTPSYRVQRDSSQWLARITKSWIFTWQSPLMSPAMTISQEALPK